MYIKLSSVGQKPKYLTRLLLSSPLYSTQDLLVNNSRGSNYSQLPTLENKLAYLYFITPPLQTPIRPLLSQDSPKSKLKVTILKAYNRKVIEPTLYIPKWVPYPLISKEKVKVIQSVIRNILVAYQYPPHSGKAFVTRANVEDCLYNQSLF